MVKLCACVCVWFNLGRKKKTVDQYVCCPLMLFSVLSQSPSNTSSNATFMQGDISQNPQLRFFQLIYGMTVIITALFATIKAFVYTNVTLNASCKLHDTMYKKVL